MQKYCGLMRVTMRSGLLAAVLFTCSCGLSKGSGSGNQPTPTPSTYVYVSGSGVAQLKVQSDGTLAYLNPSVIAAPDQYGFGFIEVDPANQYAFAGPSVFNSQTLSQFVINQDGTLTSNATATVNDGDGNWAFTFTPDSHFAIIPNFGGSTVTTYALSPSGSLSLVDDIFSCPEGPASTVVSPSGKFVYVGCQVNGPPYIAEYSISSAGMLTPLSPNSVAAVGAGNLQFGPNGFLYSVNYGSGTVTAFAIDETTGQIANAGSFPTGTGTQSEPSWMAFDPTGTYAYVVNSADTSVTQFTVNATTGALTMNGPDVPVGKTGQIGVDASGKYVFVLNGTGISQFTIGPTGRLASNGVFSFGADFAGGSMTLASR